MKSSISSRVGAARGAALLVLVSGLLAVSTPTAAEPSTRSDAPSVLLPQVADPLLETSSAPGDVVRSWEQAIELIRSQSAPVGTMLARVEQAEGSRERALSVFLPSVNVWANAQRHLFLGREAVAGGSVVERPSPAFTWSGGLTATVPILAPKAWYDYRTAETQVEAARRAAMSTERAVLASLAEAMVVVGAAERLADVSRVALRSALSILELTQRSATAGGATSLDVLRAEQEVSLSRSQVLRASEAVVRAQEVLGALLGSSRPWGLPPDFRPSDLSVQVTRTCHALRRVEERDDVESERLRVEVAERNVDAVNLGYLPMLSGISTAAVWSDPTSTANREMLTWTAGGVLTWQLLEIGLRSGARTTNLGVQREAELSLRESIRQARLESERLSRALLVAREEQRLSQRTRDLSAETANLARTALVKGISTSFELIDTTRKLREAELDLAVRDFEVVRAELAAFFSLASCDL